MRTIIVAAAALSLLGSVATAEAGCITGAIVGGVAGHMMGGHGKVGAAAGCAIGHHNAVKKQQQQQQGAPQQ